MTKTTHLGITMEWTLVRKTHRINRANPFTILGYVDGVCRMEHGTSARTLEQAEKRVINRLEQIARERGPQA